MLIISLELECYWGDASIVVKMYACIGIILIFLKIVGWYRTSPEGEIPSLVVGTSYVSYNWGSPTLIAMCL